jgi:hypothetical protein
MLRVRNNKLRKRVEDRLSLGGTSTSTGSHHNLR